MTQRTTEDTMTPADCWAAFAALDAAGLVRHEADLLRGVVVVSITDARRGNTVVRTLTAVPSPDESAALIAEMRREIKSRARATARRIRAERDLDSE